MSNESEQEALSILRAVLALSRRLRAERPDGAVSLSALSLLGTLVRSGPMPAMELAARERLKPQSVTRLIARLDQDGLIERHRSETDGRALVIAITQAGRSVLLGDLRARKLWLEQAMQKLLTEDERLALQAATGAMRKLAFSPED